jgi:hypothetical protein
MECDCTLDLNYGDVEFCADVFYHYTPGDPGVRYYPDGSGCPPTAPEIEVYKVEAHEVVTRSGLKLTSAWLDSRGWAPSIERFLLNRLSELDPYESIWYDLVEWAESCRNSG